MHVFRVPRPFLCSEFPFPRDEFYSCLVRMLFKINLNVHFYPFCPRAFCLKFYRKLLYAYYYKFNKYCIEWDITRVIPSPVGKTWFQTLVRLILRLISPDRLVFHLMGVMSLGSAESNPIYITMSGWFALACLSRSATGSYLYHVGFSLFGHLSIILNMCMIPATWLYMLLLLACVFV